MSAHRPLSRRRFLASAATLATTFQLQRAARALGLTQSATLCSLAAEQEEGPYYIAERLLRSDIREARPGLPLVLRLMFLDARSCKPLPNAVIDIWQCDALGLYSGFTKQHGFGPGGPGGRSPGPPPSDAGMRPEMMGPPPASHPSDKRTFLRGTQMADADGSVTFQTIFPGVYAGRTNHIHFKVRIGAHPELKEFTAGHVSHTGQVFFPEDTAVRMMQQGPYATNRTPRTSQSEDSVFSDQHGDLSIAKLESLHPANPAGGFRASLVAVVDPLAVPAPAARRNGPPPQFPRR